MHPSQAADEQLLQEEDVGATEVPAVVSNQPPYDFDHCTVEIHIKMKPVGDDQGERLMLVSIRNDDDPVLIRRFHDITKLPDHLMTMITLLNADLPQRAAARAQRKALPVTTMPATAPSAGKTTTKSREKKRLAAQPVSATAAAAPSPEHRDVPESIPQDPSQSTGSRKAKAKPVHPDQMSLFGD